MAIQVMKPTLKRFNFPESLEKKYGGDGDESTFIEIRQARYGENAKRNAAMSTYTRKITDKGASLESTLDLAQLYAMEIRLTLADCNILDGEGRPLFKFKDGKLRMGRDAFAAALDLLPDDVVKFIHDKVIEVNPQWDLSGE